MSEAASDFYAVSKGGEQRQCEVPELPCPHIYTHELWHTMGLSMVQDSAASNELSNASDEAVKLKRLSGRDFVNSRMKR
jgi:hypothetical protein